MMKMTKTKKLLSLLLCFVLIAAIALFNGCNGNRNTEPSGSSQTTGTEATPKALGEGKTKFAFTVTDLEGKETAFEIKTDKKTVGEALLQLELIAGDMGDYGLYVKTVNGITLDYDKDGAYWAFYVDGEYAMAGVDLTEIDENATYSFKAEKQ